MIVVINFASVFGNLPSGDMCGSSRKCRDFVSPASMKRTASGEMLTHTQLFIILTFTINQDRVCDINWMETTRDLTACKSSLRSVRSNALVAFVIGAINCSLEF